MPTAVQSSFNSGEWNPALFARVDLQKYRSGAARLQNFFVDYRGGASSRPGSKYIIQAYKSSTAVRIIPFQATFSAGYILELGHHYMRFIFQGSPVLENGFSISGATKANPCVLSIPGNNFSIGDWIFVSGVVGMTQLNGRYFDVLSVSGANVTIGTLNGVNLDSTGYSTYTSGGTAQRIYTISTPWAASDLALLKFAGQQNEMILCHPNYATQVLTLVSATNWVLSALQIGSQATIPTITTVNSTLMGGSTAYSYTVTSVDASGEESGPASPISFSGKQDIRSVAGSNSITWNAVNGAVFYNVYEAEVSYFGIIPIGARYGFIGSTDATTFVDSNIGPDFSITPPVAQNPFVGAGLSLVTVTAPGTYTSVPTASTSGGSPTIPASLLVQLQVQGTPTITSGGSGYVVGDNVYFADGLTVRVTSVSGGVITSWTVLSAGGITSGSTPSNPMSQVSTSGVGTGATATATWGVGQVLIQSAGQGYSSTPSITFSSGSATATATLQPASNGNPSVPSFFQQRLVLAGPLGAPETFYMSQPGAYFNFNITDPVQADNAITGTLVSGTLNTIKSIVSTTAGMLILTDKASWIVNGGSSGSAVSPTALVANAQSWVGASDVPPIIANYDVLYVQSKGSAVRDLSFNIYFNVFTGTDISVISSHLFYGFTVKEWTWAEQPFYLVWAVRSDGALLTLTYLKEQDFVAWTHHVTNGIYESVASVVESTATAGNVDAVYTVVSRAVGGQIVQYIERFAERTFPSGLKDAWCVDCGLQYVGSPATSFQGAEQLAGLTVSGLADGVVIPPFTMPASGFFTLANAASKVTIGLIYSCDLQTLPLEMPTRDTMQGKVKSIPAVDIRVNQTLGLEIGPDFDHLVVMKDLVVGNVSTQLTGLESQVVSDLYSGDAKTLLGGTYTVPGQYCIRQPNPYPASILGVFPEFAMRDD